ncbi:hypothetical protein Y032_0412g985 [Ancylostoma ceylanicum]|uniref:Uncharacterized protein n=1 Tax=Ancylostoma ceylanicum TaxID=53326 RepID=A0A016X417_9BILA|nr:hypothetical protein Y032_0412g985 [Ancylostoma ceylanicum]
MMTNQPSHLCLDCLSFHESQLSIFSSYYSCNCIPNVPYSCATVLCIIIYVLVLVAVIAFEFPLARTSVETSFVSFAVHIAAYVRGVIFHVSSGFSLAKTA